MIEILKVLEECCLSRPPYRTFACYLHLVAATGLLSVVPILLHRTFWGGLVLPVPGQQGECHSYKTFHQAISKRYRVEVPNLGSCLIWAPQDFINTNEILG